MTLSRYSIIPVLILAKATWRKYRAPFGHTLNIPQIYPWYAKAREEARARYCVVRQYLSMDLPLIWLLRCVLPCLSFDFNLVAHSWKSKATSIVDDNELKKSHFNCSVLPFSIHQYTLPGLSDYSLCSINSASIYYSPVYITSSDEHRLQTWNSSCVSTLLCAAYHLRRRWHSSGPVVALWPECPPHCSWRSIAVAAAVVLCQLLLLGRCYGRWYSGLGQICQTLVGWTFSLIFNWFLL